MPLFRNAKMLLVYLLLGIALGGCRTIPVHNIYEAGIVSASGHRVTLAKAKKAIVRAGVRHGWSMKSIQPGHIVATLDKRKHMVQVDVTYNTHKYSITYKNSKNLKYNRDTEEIHARYAEWVNNLDRQIRVEFNNL